MRLDDEPLSADDAADALRQADATAADGSTGGLRDLAEGDTPDLLDPRVGMPVDDPLDDPRVGGLADDDLAAGSQG
jgi:hypothetical protein